MNWRIINIVLALMLAAPLTAACTSGHAEGLEVALERKVVDSDRGVRATITYRPEVMTGGQEEIVNSDGTVSILHWDGFAGQFTAEITEGEMTKSDGEAFLKEAVIFACPSVDRAELKKQWVQHAGPFLRVFAQCPKIDKARK